MVKNKERRSVRREVRAFQEEEIACATILWQEGASEDKGLTKSNSGWGEGRE